MVKPAFSTVACPDWTLERVARFAAEHAFAGVELRSFGDGSTDLACDPALTDGAKVHALFRDAGVAVCGLGTGVSFDAPIVPPVLGRLLPSVDDTVRDGRHLVDVASRSRAGYVRVYGFELGRRESRRGGLRRICDRLARVCDHARHRDVRVVLENGGSFASAEDLLEITRRVGSPLLEVCYDLAAACSVEDDWEAGVGALAPALAAVRVRDARGGEACPPGEGELPVEAFVRRVAALGGRDVWAVLSWDKLWDTSLADAEHVLPDAVRRLYEWSDAAAHADVAA
jgi:sugar phosphate isomerase/epimerase